MGGHFKMISSEGILRGRCIASKVGRWVGGQKVLFELYALVAVYKYVYIVQNCYTYIICCCYGHEHFDDLDPPPFQEQMAKEKIIQGFQYCGIK